MKFKLINIILFTLLVTFSAQAQLKKPTVQPKKETTAKPQVKVVERVKVVEKDNDRDGDGIIDSMDKCPDEWGEMKNEGCPKNRNLYGLTDSNGSKYDYEGETLDGLPDGNGKATYTDGHYITSYGVQTLNINKGDVYIGNFSKGVIEGYGTFTGTTEKYMGNWKNDKRNGSGTCIYSDGSIYTGDWVDNNIHGKGKFTFTDGRIYEGDFAKNIPNGKGTYLWKDGSKYIGDIKNFKRHGKGEYYNETGVLIFKGEYNENKEVEGTNTVNTRSNLVATGNLNIVKGKVVDRHGEPIIGASILIKGTTKGTISNVEGEFEIDFSFWLGREKRWEDILQFKYVGFKTKEIVLGNQTNITVVLK